MTFSHRLAMSALVAESQSALYRLRLRHQDSRVICSEARLVAISFSNLSFASVTVSLGLKVDNLLVRGDGTVEFLSNELSSLLVGADGTLSLFGIFIIARRSCSQYSRSEQRSGICWCF